MPRDLVLEARSSAPSRELTAAALFEEHAPFAWRVLRRLGVRDADADDACQEVFLTVHRRLSAFEGRSSPRTWIYGICVRVASDYRNRATTRREVSSPTLPEQAVEASQVGDVALHEARVVLDRILDDLDDEKRAAFVLYEIEELTLKELATALGCPLQTAFSRLQGASPELRELLAAGRSEMPDAKRMVAVAGRLGLLVSMAPGGLDALARSTGKWLGAGAAKVGATVLLLGVGTAVVVARSHPAPRASEPLVTSAATPSPLPASANSVGVSESYEAPTTTEAPAVPTSRPRRATRGRLARPAGPAPTAATNSAPSEPAASHEAREWAPSTWGSSAATAMPLPPSSDDSADAVQRAERELPTRPSLALELALRNERSAGGLLEPRDAVIIEALVRLGRMDEARRRAARFLRVFPGSVRRRELAELVGFDPGIQNR